MFKCEFCHYEAKTKIRLESHTNVQHKIRVQNALVDFELSLVNINISMSKLYIHRCEPAKFEISFANRV